MSKNIVDLLFESMAHIGASGLRPQVERMALSNDVIEQMRHRCELVKDEKLAVQSTLLGIPFTKTDMLPDGVFGIIFFKGGDIAMLVTDEYVERANRLQAAAAMAEKQATNATAH